jgi:hypothetical protein
MVSSKLTLTAEQAGFSSSSFEKLPIKSQLEELSSMYRYPVQIGAEAKSLIIVIRYRYRYGTDIKKS